MKIQLLKPLFLLLGLLFVVSCQEDIVKEDIQAEDQADKKEISDYVKSNQTFTGKEAKKKLRLGLSKMKRIGVPSLAKSSAADSISFSFGTVKTDKVVQTFDVSNKENLVYDIELNDPDPKRFYNLVITTRPDGSESAYLFGYSMSDKFYTAYTTQGESLSNFEGSTFSLNLDETSSDFSAPSDCEDFMATVNAGSSSSNNSGGGGPDSSSNNDGTYPSGGSGDFFGGGIPGSGPGSGPGSSTGSQSGGGSSSTGGGGGSLEQIWDAIGDGAGSVGDAAGDAWDWISGAANDVYFFLRNWLCGSCKTNSSPDINDYSYNAQEIDPQVNDPIGENPCAPVATAIIGRQFSNSYIANYILEIPEEDVELLMNDFDYYWFYHASLDFLVENNFTDEALAFFHEALEIVKSNDGGLSSEEAQLLFDIYNDSNPELSETYLEIINNQNVSISKIYNWFINQQNNSEIDQVTNPDLIQYDSPLQQEVLPSFNDFKQNFPKLGTEGNYSAMPTSQVYNLVGGSLLNSHNQNPQAYSNACSIRGSRGLLYSGIDIPVLIYDGVGQRTQKGGDNKNYILDAVSFDKFMKDKFGDATYELTDSSANDPEQVANLLNGKNGIYVIINNNQIQAGYSGHVDLIIDGTCISSAYTTPSGGVKSIRIWELD